jgi:hypothetical protein
MSRFEWDEEKNLVNQRKHGISFEEASTIFEGPVLSLEDEGYQSEVRAQLRSHWWRRGCLRCPYGSGWGHTDHQHAQSDQE